jgi:hypothetical protein
MYQLKVSIAIALQFIALVVVAQRPELITDRPDQSNSPVLIPVGALQVESGFAMEKDKYQQPRLVNYTFNNLLVKFGVNENVEAQLGFSYLGIDSLEGETTKLRGFSPVSLGAKIKLAEARGIWPQAALIAHVALRSEAIKLSPDYTGADLTLAFAHDLSSALAFTYNFGINWKGDAPEPVWTYTISTAYQLSEKAGIFIESYGFFPEGERADHRLDGGLTFKLRPMLQADVSGGIGLSSKSPAYFLSTGLSCRLFK